MPPRRGKVRAKVRHEAEWSPRVALELTSGAPPFGRSFSVAGLRETWLREREFLLASSIDVAQLAGFWRFEPGIPDDLRPEPPVLRPVGSHRADREELIRRRRAWLLEHRPDLDKPKAA